ncbi:MAG TPA: hypothetical protein VMW72_04300 [Sedimentisphaerales bacterium]|nr:hypothetical protein [Sedimentisphaerales bacterium]
MWTILSIIAVVSLIFFFARGPNPIWGGATGGLIIGAIVALVRDGFEWSTIWKGIVVGIILGVIAEILGRLSKRMG